MYRRYEQLCSQKKILDKIFLPNIYDFNKEFAKLHKKIVLHVDGHLTNFEISLLERCCEYSEITIIFKTSKFNTKMQSKFFDIGIELGVGYEYKISLNTKEVISSKKIKRETKIECESFSEELLQVAFVKKKVYDYVSKGYEPQNIAVILPDEKFTSNLKLFDTKSNFNFAMGISFSQTKIYEKLNTSCMAIEQLCKENSARLQRVGDEIYAKLFSIYYKKVQEVDILNLLESFLDLCIVTKVEKSIFKEQIYSLQNILPSMQDMSVKSLLSLFMQRLRNASIDDTSGGKITVMGVLETRSVEFDAIVIVDFSDNNVPKRSDKDMFLNTKIREISNLPTMSDRENLQKHYYEMLINSSKEVSISYLSSDKSSESRFLKYLGIKAENIYKETDYAKILFSIKSEHVHKEIKPIILEYSFRGKKLSSTKLKSFLTCKRKYYYSYVKHLDTHKIPKDMPEEYEIGNVVHDALKELYSKKSYYSDISELQRDLDRELDATCRDSELDKYLISMQKKVLIEFCKNDIKRFNDGYRVLYCEKSFECEFEGIILNGIIDRVDEKDNELFVLDYKTGSYPIYTPKNFTEATDFQLEFYYILASSKAKVRECGYYDLKNSKIVAENLLEEKLSILKSHVKDLLNIKEVNFEMC